MKYSLLILLLLTVQTHAAQWLSDDVLVSTITDPAKVHALATPPSTDCRAAIALAMCLVDPMMKGQEPLDRVCLEGSTSYAAPFEQLYDAFPEHLQKMFCSLRRIFIEKEFFASAYALYVKDKNDNMITAGVGIRRDFLDQQMSANHWSTWKEQLNFGGDPKAYQTREDLVQVETTLTNGLTDLLYFTLAHEFGHLFDFANHLNGYENCKIEDGQVNGPCTPAPGSWTALSWGPMTQAAPLSQYDFPLRASLCFYGCDGHFIAADQASALYQSLFKTNFLSVYAAVSPWEDFADTHAYYEIDLYRHANYRINLPGGESFDPLARFHSADLKSKLDFISQFYAGKVIYPGDVNSSASAN